MYAAAAPPRPSTARIAMMMPTIAPGEDEPSALLELPELPEACGSTVEVGLVAVGPGVV